MFFFSPFSLDVVFVWMTFAVTLDVLLFNAKLDKDYWFVMVDAVEDALENLSLTVTEKFARAFAVVVIKDWK